MCDWNFYSSFLVGYGAKFLSIAIATVQNFNEIEHKKGHKKTIDIFQNSLYKTVRNG